MVVFFITKEIVKYLLLFYIMAMSIKMFQMSPVKIVELRICTLFSPLLKVKQKIWRVK